MVEVRVCSRPEQTLVCLVQIFGEKASQALLASLKAKGLKVERKTH